LPFSLCIGLYTFGWFIHLKLEASKKSWYMYVPSTGDSLLCLCKSPVLSSDSTLYVLFCFCCVQGTCFIGLHVLYPRSFGLALCFYDSVQFSPSASCLLPYQALSFCVVISLCCYLGIISLQMLHLTSPVVPIARAFCPFLCPPALFYDCNNLAFCRLK